MSERIRSVDANLLLALHALVEERTLTHAGIRMTMSQPAMSGALTGLRRHFGDELLVRHGREFEREGLGDLVEAGEEPPVCRVGLAVRGIPVALGEDDLAEGGSTATSPPHPVWRRGQPLGEDRHHVGALDDVRQGQVAAHHDPDLAARRPSSPRTRSAGVEVVPAERGDGMWQRRRGRPW